MCEEAPSNSVHGVSKHGMMRNIVASNLGSISESMNASEGKSPSIFSATSLPQTNSPMKEDNRMEPSRPSDGMVSVTLPSNIQLVPSELDASSNSALLAHGGTKGGLPRRQRMIADEEDKVQRRGNTSLTCEIVAYIERFHGLYHPAYSHPIRRPGWTGSRPIQSSSLSTAESIKYHKAWWWLSCLILWTWGLCILQCKIHHMTAFCITIVPAQAHGFFLNLVCNIILGLQYINDGYPFTGFST